MRQLTIVIPTYNESENLPALTSQLWALPIPDLHILIVDDGSPDGTGEVAEDLASLNSGRMRVIHRAGKLGLGTAYINGFTRALADGAQAVGQMDADFSHSPDYLPQFMDLLEDADVVLGSRYIKGGSLDERWGIGRVLLSWFGNEYARRILGLRILDTTGGFRV
ncbi:MAG: glycosyltransferase, partial [Anaerolineales bacterium]